MDIFVVITALLERQSFFGYYRVLAISPKNSKPYKIDTHFGKTMNSYLLRKSKTKHKINVPVSRLCLANSQRLLLLLLPLGCLLQFYLEFESLLFFSVIVLYRDGRFFLFRIPWQTKHIHSTALLKANTIISFPSLIDFRLIFCPGYQEAIIIEPLTYFTSNRFEASSEQERKNTIGKSDDFISQRGDEEKSRKYTYRNDECRKQINVNQKSSRWTIISW